MNEQQKNSLIEVALQAARQEQNWMGPGHLICKVAVTIARDGKFKEAVELCREYWDRQPLLLGTLFEIACEAMRIGIRQERDRDDYQLDCYMDVLPYLAEKWQEKVEETIDYLLERRLGEYTEGYIKLLIPSVLCNMALIIRKYGLRWNEERQDQFQNLLQEVEK